MNENKKILATPKIRKFARLLGANIYKIEGSARGGRITEEDVKNFVNKNLNEPQAKEKIQVKLEFNHSEFGEIEMKDIPRVKKLSSKYLMNSWSNIPHVTNHDEADISELEEFRNSLTDNFTGT